MSDDNLTWFKSSHSGGENNECVEVAFAPEGGAYVRDSKDPGGGKFVLPPAAWQGFIEAVRSSQPDRTAD